MRIYAGLGWLIAFALNVGLVFSIPPYSAFDELHHTIQLFYHFPDLIEDNFVYSLVHTTASHLGLGDRLGALDLNPLVSLKPVDFFDVHPYYLIPEGDALVYELRLIQVGLAWTFLFAFTYLIAKWRAGLPSYMIEFVIPFWLIIPVVAQNIISIGSQFILIPIIPLLIYLVTCEFRRAAVSVLISFFFWEGDGQFKIFAIYLLFQFIWLHWQRLNDYRYRLSNFLVSAIKIDISSNKFFVICLCSLPFILILINWITVISFKKFYDFSTFFFPHFFYIQDFALKGFTVAFFSVVGFGFSSAILFPISYYFLFYFTVLVGSIFFILNRKFWFEIFPAILLWLLLTTLLPGLGNLRYHFFMVGLFLVVGTRFTTDFFVQKEGGSSRLGILVFVSLVFYNLSILAYFHEAIE